MAIPSSPTSGSSRIEYISTGEPYGGPCHCYWMRLMFGTGASKEQLVEQHKAWPTRKLLFSAEDFLAQFENPKIDGPLVLITFSQEELVYQLAKDIAALPSKFHYEGKNPFHMGNKFLHKIFEIPVKKYP